MSRLFVSILAASTLLGACGGASENQTIAVVPPPERSAAEDRRIRLLLLDLAEAQLCKQLEGSFMALPDSSTATSTHGESPRTAGRLWIKECEVSVEARDFIQEASLSMHLSGPGWTWVEQSTDGPLGTSFTVKGHLRFVADMTLAGAIDVAYDDRHRVVTLWMTPRTPAAAGVVPTGSIPVEPDGGWSSLIASVGSWFGPNLEERAAPMVEEQGSRNMAEQLSKGITFTIDLCSGQLDSMVGPLSNGTTPTRPFVRNRHVWHQNLRVALRREGLEVSGPFPDSGNALRLDMEVEAGSPVRVAAYCQTAGTQLVQHYLDAASGTPSPRPEVGLPIWRASVAPGRIRAYQIAAQDCPMMLVMRPDPGAPDETVFRYRVFDEGARTEPLVSCEGLSARASH